MALVLNLNSVTRDYLSLKSIAEDSHLLYFKPQRFKDIKKPRFEKIGVNDCTGFNGFCKMHDDQFQEIDQNKITTTKHIKLQLYRSLTSELHKEQVGKFLHDFDNKNLQEMLEPIRPPNETSENFFNSAKNTIQNSLEKNLTLMRLDPIDNLRLYILKIIDNDNAIIAKNALTVFTTKNLEHQVFCCKTDFQIPVAINTKSILTIGNTSFNNYFICVPYENSTIIIGAIPNIAPTFILNKINQAFSTKIGIIKFIESIMASNDDWFIKPSIIERMPQSKIDLLCDDFMFINERRFFNDYDISIFNDLKVTVCGINENTPELNLLPQRDSYEVRYKRMINTIEASLIPF